MPNLKHGWTRHVCQGLSGDELVTYTHPNYPHTAVQTTHGEFCVLIDSRGGGRKRVFCKTFKDLRNAVHDNELEKTKSNGQ